MIEGLLYEIVKSALIEVGKHISVDTYKKIKKLVLEWLSEGKSREEIKENLDDLILPNGEINKGIYEDFGLLDNDDEN